MNGHPTAQTPRPMRCLGCAYILEGLPEDRCPECGCGFDPDDSETFFTQFRSGWRYVLEAMAALLALAIAVALPLAIEKGAGWIAILAPLQPILNLGAIIAFLHVIGVSCASLLRPRANITHRAAYVLALIVALSVLIFLVVAFFKYLESVA